MTDRFGIKTLLYGFSFMVVVVIAAYFLSEEIKSRPDFCRSCHLKEKRLHGKKFDDFLSSNPVNLAGRHRTENMNCTDCHRGVDLQGKAAVLYEETKNSFKYFVGAFAEPDRLNPNNAVGTLRQMPPKLKRKNNKHVLIRR